MFKASQRSNYSHEYGPAPKCTICQNSRIKYPVLVWLSNLANAAISMQNVRHRNRVVQIHMSTHHLSNTISNASYFSFSIHMIHVIHSIAKRWHSSAYKYCISPVDHIIFCSPFTQHIKGNTTTKKRKTAKLSLSFSHVFRFPFIFRLYIAGAHIS